MKLLNLILTAALALAASTALATAPTAGAETADALVKRISQDVIDSAKADKEIQAGNQKKVADLVETRILLTSIFSA